MSEIVFESQLLKDGHLYCPKEYATPRAKFKVIVSIPDEFATDSEIELASAIDNSDESLSKEEVNYMNLDKAYREMAGDNSRETEALEWSEATVGDSVNET